MQPAKLAMSWRLIEVTSSNAHTAKSRIHRTDQAKLCSAVRAKHVNTIVPQGQVNTSLLGSLSSIVLVKGSFRGGLTTCQPGTRPYTAHTARPAAGADNVLHSLHKRSTTRRPLTRYCTLTPEAGKEDKTSFILLLICIRTRTATHFPSLAASHKQDSLAGCGVDSSRVGCWPALERPQELSGRAAATGPAVHVG